MKFNLQKAKHLYYIYGAFNSFVIVAVLVIVYLLYNKYSIIDRFNSSLNNELIILHEYKDRSNTLAMSSLFKSGQNTVFESTEENAFIQKINESKQEIITVSEQHAVSNTRFSENIRSLVFDYEELGRQNGLLINYLTAIGNEEKGLYAKLNMASADFGKKLNYFNPNTKLITGYNTIIATIRLFKKSRNEELSITIKKQLAEFDEALEAIGTGGDNYIVLRLKDSFKNFETSYLEFAKKTHEIGLSPNQGLISKINKSYEKATFRLKQLVEILANEKRNTERFVLFSTALGVLLIALFNFISSKFFINNTKTFIDELIDRINELDKGSFKKFNKSNFPVEMHSMLTSFENFSQRLIHSVEAYSMLSAGRTSIDFNKKKQLEIFRTNLEKIKAQIEELNQQVRVEKKKQTNMLWIKSGIEKLTGIMRRDYDNPLLHASEVVNMLVKFLNIPIGAIYNIKEEGGKKYVEMMASFAYGKEKQLYQKIEIGEGIIGTAALEKKTLNLTSVPEGYFNIISGLGETRPKNILVSPIKLNEEIYGVFELASLTKFKKEEVEFVEEVCRTVAYSFAISKIYLDTLYQFEGLNMEIAQLEAENASLTNDYDELNKNYKELTIKSTDNNFIVDKINEMAIVVDLDLDGNIQEVNAGFENFFKSGKLKVLHSNFREYMTGINITEGYDIELIWKDVRAGIQHEINQKVMFSDKEYILNQHFLPIKDEKGRVRKIKVIAFDFSSKMGQETEQA